MGPGAGPHGLFVTLPGYEGLWFQGEAQNLRSEDFSFEALEHDPSLIVVAPQLMDWRERSAREVIANTEHVIASYDVDTSRVYLEGFSGGGETGSLVMGMKPGLYTAFLAVSTRWDGDLEVLADSRTPVYLAVGEDDSYYGSGPLKRAYDELVDIFPVGNDTIPNGTCFNPFVYFSSIPNNFATSNTCLKCNIIISVYT